MHIENLIRSENGVPLRSWYGVNFGEGRALMQGTRLSCNYFRRINYTNNIGAIRIQKTLNLFFEYGKHK
jgi:hypothetical protein